MRIAIACMLQESNTFSPVYTRYDDFTPVSGKAVLERHRGKLTEMGGFLDILDSASVEVAPVCAAWAITANRLLRPDFERLLGEFETGLRKAKPDALLLVMHGAQTAEGEDDVEGCVLTIARRQLAFYCAFSAAKWNPPWPCASVAMTAVSAFLWLFMNPPRTVRNA